MITLDTSDSRTAKAFERAEQAASWLKCRTAGGRKAYGIRSSRDANHVYFVTLSSAPAKTPAATRATPASTASLSRSTLPVAAGSSQPATSSTASSGWLASTTPRLAAAPAAAGRQADSAAVEDLEVLDPDAAFGAVDLEADALAADGALDVVVYTDPREIRRLACLKAAAAFAAGRAIAGQDVTSADVVKVAEAFERWVTKGDEQLT